MASALRWLGRGQGYRAVVREIAWTAARAVPSSGDDLEWLTPLVDARLGERFDRLPRVAREAALQAEEQYLHARPHDHDGADLAAELGANDAAVEHLSTAYMDVLDWSVGLLQERRAKAPSRLQRLIGRSSAQTGAEPVACEVPQRILDGLTLRSDQPGWTQRDAA